MCLQLELNPGPLALGAGIHHVTEKTDMWQRSEYLAEKRLHDHARRDHARLVGRLDRPGLLSLNRKPSHPPCEAQLFFIFQPLPSPGPPDFVLSAHMRAVVSG